MKTRNPNQHRGQLGSWIVLISAPLFVGAANPATARNESKPILSSAAVTAVVPVHKSQKSDSAFIATGQDRWMNGAQNLNEADSVRLRANFIRNLSQGGVDIGGGNAVGSQMVEDFIKPLEKIPGYSVYQDRVKKLGEYYPKMPAALEKSATAMLFYLVPVNLFELSYKQTGIPFSSAQPAVQIQNEVFINQNYFKPSNTEGWGRLLIHEISEFYIFSQARKLGVEEIKNGHLSLDQFMGSVRATSHLISNIDRFTEVQANEFYRNKIPAVRNGVQVSWSYEDAQTREEVLLRQQYEREQQEAYAEQYRKQAEEAAVEKIKDDRIAELLIPVATYTNQLCEQLQPYFRGVPQFEEDSFRRNLIMQKYTREEIKTVFSLIAKTAEEVRYYLFSQSLVRDGSFSYQEKYRFIARNGGNFPPTQLASEIRILLTEADGTNRYGEYFWSLFYEKEDYKKVQEKWLDGRMMSKCSGQRIDQLSHECQNFYYDLRGGQLFKYELFCPKKGSGSYIRALDNKKIGF